MSETFAFDIQPEPEVPYFQATKRAGCRSWGSTTTCCVRRCPTTWSRSTGPFFNGATMWDAAVERAGDTGPMRSSSRTCLCAVI